MKTIRIVDFTGDMILCRKIDFQTVFNIQIQLNIIIKKIYNVKYWNMSLLLKQDLDICGLRVPCAEYRVSSRGGSATRPVG